MKEEIASFLLDNQIETAIKKMVFYFQITGNKEMYNNVIIQSAKFNENKNYKLKDLISHEEFKRTNSQILNALSCYLDNIKNSNTFDFQKTIIGIITILPEELAAVTDYFIYNNSYKDLIGSKSKRTFYTGQIGDNLSAIVVQAIEQGNRSVISAYNALVEEYNPSFIVLLGIAGAIQEKVEIGDVVIAESIYYYDKRAVTINGNKHRIDAYKINAWTKVIIQKFHHVHKSEEPLFNSSINSPKSQFKCYYAPIGSGEAIIKNTNADERVWLLEVNEKVLAIETEAGGVAQQFYEDSLKNDTRTKGLLVIRGISDKADTEKKDEWRLAASKNAMKVLIELLKEVKFNE